MSATAAATNGDWSMVAELRAALVNSEAVNASLVARLAEAESRVRFLHEAIAGYGARQALLFDSVRRLEAFAFKVSATHMAAVGGTQAES